MKLVEIHVKPFARRFSFYAVMNCLEIMVIIKIIDDIIID